MTTLEVIEIIVPGPIAVVEIVQPGQQGPPGATEHKVRQVQQVNQARSEPQGQSVQWDRKVHKDPLAWSARRAKQVR